MKVDFTYKEGTTPGFIIAGISFVLLIFGELFQVITPTIVLFFPKLFYPLQYMASSSQPISILTAYINLLVVLSTIPLCIGCFTKGKAIFVTGVSFILYGLFQMLSSLVSVFAILFYMLRMDTFSKFSTFSKLNEAFSYSTRGISAFLVFLLFVFFGICCFLRLKKRALNITAGALIIAYSGIRFLMQTGSLISTLYLIKASGMAMLAAVCVYLLPILASFISIILFTAGGVALFFIAGRVEYPLIPWDKEGQEEIQE